MEGYKFIQKTYLLTYLVIHTYTEKTAEYSYTISVLLESSIAELWSLENGRDSYSTLDIRAIPIYEQYRVPDHFTNTNM